MDRFEKFIGCVMLWKAVCLNIQHRNLLFKLTYLNRNDVNYFLLPLC